MDAKGPNLQRKISIKKSDNSLVDSITVSKTQNQCENNNTIKNLHKIFLSTISSLSTSKIIKPHPLNFSQALLMEEIIELFNMLKNKPFKQEKAQQFSNKSVSDKTPTSKKSKFEKVNKNLKQKSHSNKSIYTSNNFLSDLSNHGNKLHNLCDQFYSQIKKSKSGPKQYLQNISVNSILLLIKGYCLLLTLNIYLLSFSAQFQIIDLTNFQRIIENVKEIMNLPKQLLNLQQNNIVNQVLMFTLKQVFSLTTLNQYSFYNIDTNEQFKYDEDTQIQFLFCLSLIKLSEHLDILKHYATYGQNNHYIMEISKRIKFKTIIYKEGKQLISKCSILLNNIKLNSESVKIQAIKQKIIIVQEYIQWIQIKWIQKIQKKTSEELQQMPLYYLYLYELFYLIYEFGGIQKQIKNSQTLSHNFSTSKSFGFNTNTKKKHQQIIKLQQKLQKILLNQKRKDFQSEFSQKSKQKQVQMNQALILIETVVKMLEKYLNQLENQRKLSNLQITNIIQNDSFKFVLDKVEKSSKNNQIPEKNQHLEIYSENNIKESNQNDKEKLKENLCSEKNKNTFEKILKQKKEIIQISATQKMNRQKPSSQKIQMASHVTKLSQSPLHKKILSVCRAGQYLTKFNFGNSSYSMKYVKLSSKGDKILWGDSRQDLKNQDDGSQYKLQKVNGIVFGNVSNKIVFHCEKTKNYKQPILPQRCFSFICEDRTLDFYCHVNQYDVFFWLQGISSYLQVKYKRQINFSRGKILWKKMLLIIKYIYLPTRSSKSKQYFYLGRDNARAINQFGKSLKQNKKLS